jgi:hypothetical protein
MTKLTFIDKYIEEKLLAKNEKERKNHKSSGKLSASALGLPLQWQILKVIGVPSDDLQEYTIRKFLRGNHIEDWLVKNMVGVEDTQIFVDYHGVIGYLDVLVDMSEWNLPDLGVLPHEIKSVSNAKFRFIKEEPDKHHVLQATLYALALDKEKFCIDYVATDDYRVETYLLETKDYKAEVDSLINKFNKVLSEKIVPAFEPTASWQENDKYNSYLEFKELSPVEIDMKLKEEYPKAYKVLKGKK